VAGIGCRVIFKIRSQGVGECGVDARSHRVHTVHGGRTSGCLRHGSSLVVDDDGVDDLSSPAIRVFE
jgi:hypothetical protein